MAPAKKLFHPIDNTTANLVKTTAVKTLAVIIEAVNCLIISVIKEGRIDVVEKLKVKVT